MPYTNSGSLSTQYGYILGHTRDSMVVGVEVDIEFLVNDLVGPLPDEGFIIRTACDWETVDIAHYHIDDISPSTSITDAWEESVEVSFFAVCDPEPIIGLMTFDDALLGGPLPGPGHYRILVCASNREAVMESERRGDEPNVHARFSIHIWPAAPSDPIIHKSIGFKYNR